MTSSNFPGCSARWDHRKLEFLDGELTQNRLLSFRMGEMQLMETRGEGCLVSVDVEGVGGPNDVFEVCSQL